MRSLRIWNLRLKLTLWFLSIYVVLQVTLLFAVVLYRQEAIQRAFDADMRHWAEVIAERAAGEVLPETPDDLRAMIPAESGIQEVVLRDRRGRLMRSSRTDNAPIPFLAPGPGGEQPLKTIFATLTGVAGETRPLRVITLPVRSASGDSFLFLQAARPTIFLERAFGAFKDLLLLGVPISLLSASIAAWLIAGRAVNPMKRIAEAARGVAPSSFDGRIEVQTTDREAAKLQSELNSALERLAAGYRAQDRFIADVSHELKTPIAVVLAQAQSLGEGNTSRAELAAFAHSAADEMRRLGKLVESYLTMTRTELGQRLVSRRFVPVNDFVLEAVMHCSPFAQQHEVRLLPKLEETEEEPTLVLGDAELLRTMLDNLLLNAIRFSPEGETVEVNVERSGERALIRVRDRGPGIPEEHIASVFDRYTQAPQDAMRATGTGLGLAIAQGVAKLHGGSISVRNEPDQGCSFVIELPVADDDGSEPG